MQDKQEKKKIDIADCFDLDFINNPIPDDFLYEDVAMMYKNDPCIKVVQDDLEYQGLKLSGIRVFDFNEQVVHCGVKELIKPAYLPKENFKNLDVVFKWADRLIEGYVEDYPDPIDAPPLIPHNQYYRPEEEYVVENFFASLGCVVVDPSYGFMEDYSHYKFATLNDRNGIDKIESFSSDTVFFLPFRDLMTEDIAQRMKDRKYVAMCYNPFHPMAIHITESFTWAKDDREVWGYYRYKDLERKFIHSLDDTRYRLDSVTWLRMMPRYKYDSMMECYDLVSNFNFLQHFKISFLKQEVYVEPLMIHPVIASQECVYKKIDLETDGLVPVKNARIIVRSLIGVHQDPYNPYSWRSYYRVASSGHSVIARCLYANWEMPVHKDKTFFLDISHLCSYNKEGRVIKIDNLNGPSVVLSVLNGDVNHDDVYIRIKDNDKLYVVLAIRGIARVRQKKPSGTIVFNKIKQVAFLRVKLKFEGKEDRYDLNPLFPDPINLYEYASTNCFLMFEETPLKFYSYPRNRRGGAVADFKTMSLQDAHRMNRSTLHAYWPAIVPFSLVNQDATDYSSYMEQDSGTNLVVDGNVISAVSGQYSCIDDLIDNQGEEQDLRCDLPIVYLNDIKARKKIIVNK